MRTVIALAVLFLLACSPYRGLRKQTITYEGGSRTVYVPRKWKTISQVHTPKKDSGLYKSGQIYDYGGSRWLYFVQVQDTIGFFREIDTTQHVPVIHPIGARMYKRIDSAGRYWREVQQGRMRYGYTNISFDDQIKFDTAVNSAIVPRKRRGLF